MMKDITCTRPNMDAIIMPIHYYVKIISVNDLNDVKMDNNMF